MNKKIYYLVVLIIFLSSYSIIRFGEFGTGVQDQTLPMLYRMDNSSYLINDWYTNDVSNFNVRSIDLYFTLALNKIVDNLEKTYLFIYLLLYPLIFINIFYLANQFFKDETKSFFITVLSFIAITFSLDGTDLTKLIPTPATIAWLFGLISFNLYLRGKYLLAFLFNGISTLFQAIIGGIVFSALIGGIIFNLPIINKKKFFTILKTAPFFLISTVAIIPLFKSESFASNPDISIYATYIYSRFAHPGHVLISSHSLLVYLNFLLFMTLLIWTFNKFKCEKKLKQQLVSFFVIVVLTHIMGFFFTEIYPISLITKMDLFRSGIILNLFGYIFIGDYIYNQIENSKWWLEKVFWYITPLCLISPLTLVIGLTLVFTIIILKSRFGLDILKLFSKEKTVFSVIIVLFLTAVAIFLRDYSIEKIYPFLPTTSHSTIAYLIAPILFYFFALLFLKSQFKKTIIVWIIVLTIFALVYYPPLERDYTFDKETREVFNFMKFNTPKESIILTPPQDVGFRINGERAIVVDRLHHHTDEGIVEWFNRMKAVSNNVIKDPIKNNFEELEGAYNSLNKDDIINLRSKYGISYAVFEKPKRVNLPIAFENGKFVIYRLD
ncbi:MAG: hypothetical protein Q8Q01_00415 [archaeon]|nr:hypothetical protein [archaeon]